ncbi:MAG TPA: cellulose binding domain-containing protein [Actinocrinis sp.]|uniref:cellulose binding domain-containing protein n=1 Tax=Actinocrinis sp. TaxID=1920516 RepID=UPI002D6437EA|nr:cellulose binding domain-containing protein [Actinocrinis sp.]HZU56339.1 cellulose binding domain-containing protein [Actinocrinis sp.]
MGIRRQWLAAALAPALAVGALAAGAAIKANVAVAASNGVKVMPLGDSITDGLTVPGGYRIGLCQRLVAGGYNVNFVGSLSNGPALACSQNHEGHSGWRIDQIDANIVGWLNTYQPHTVLLHIGTNDISQNYDLPNAPNRLSALIDHITNTLPSAEVFVAQIIPLSYDAAQLQAFNAAIPGIVQSKVAAGKHVHLVDMYDALTTADLQDGVHPNAAGYDKMAAVWYRALLSVPGSIGNPGQPSGSPTPTQSPSTSPSASPSASATGGSGACRVSDTVSAWNTGMTENITVTNTGSTAINGWRLAFTLAGGQTVTNAWNATISPTSGAVTATNVSYNAAIPPGGNTSFGFQANHTGNSAPPTGFALNGVACSTS